MNEIEELEKLEIQLEKVQAIIFKIRKRLTDPLAEKVAFPRQLKQSLKSWKYVERQLRKLIVRLERQI
ncbi:MAG: hypothetical protein V1674_06105 [Candidatus Omnitrophota bacterium]